MEPYKTLNKYSFWKLCQDKNGSCIGPEMQSHRDTLKQNTQSYSIYILP